MIKYLKKIEKDPRVSSVSDETQFGDGYWITLKDGFCCDTALHTIHEYTVRDLRHAMTDVKTCTCCESCKAATLGIPI